MVEFIFPYQRWVVDELERYSSWEGNERLLVTADMQPVMKVRKRKLYNHDVCHYQQSKLNDEDDKS